MLNRALLHAVDQYAQTINSEKNGDISKTAMMIDAPLLTSLRSQHNKMPAEFLSDLIENWFEKGGRKVMIISEIASEAKLFSSKYMQQSGLIMQPVGPGFSAEIYQGLGEFIGVWSL